MKRTLALLAALFLMTPVYADESDDVFFTPEFYKKIKASSKVSLVRDGKNQVIMEYFIYDRNTGAVIKQPQIVVDVNLLNDQRSSYTQRIANIDELLADIGKL